MTPAWNKLQLNRFGIMSKDENCEKRLPCVPKINHPPNLESQQQTHTHFELLLLKSLVFIYLACFILVSSYLCELPLSHPFLWNLETPDTHWCLRVTVRRSEPQVAQTQRCHGSGRAAHVTACANGRRYFITYLAHVRLCVGACA